ncbi:MAG: ArnT family glycosyltransferase [Rudaea sp.]
MAKALERAWPLLLLLGIISLGTFLRLYRLDLVPPGFHYDEAFNAIQARDILRGVSRPIFITANFGEEPLQMYVEAAVFALAGMSPYTARLSNVVLGLLLIPALYFCARALFGHGRTVALTAAFVGATLYWAINFSRLGIETNSLPWILTLSAGALYLAYSRGDWRWSLGAGFLLSLCLYTYLASRLWPLALFFWFVYLLIVHRVRVRAGLANWLLVVTAAAVTAAPLAIFFVLNPTALTGRSGQVLTFDQLAGNLLRTAGMFFISGDMDPRNNLPGRPALDIFLAALFLIGLILSVRRWKQAPYALLLIWFVTMTLPSALTEFAPNLRRAIGALPAVALLCGVGAEWLVAKLPASVPNAAPILRAKWAIPSLLIVALGLSAWSSAFDYFEKWAGGTGLYYSFDAGLLQVAQTLAERPTSENLCLSPDYHDHPTILWALDGRPFSSFDGRRAAALPVSGQPATCAIIVHEDTVFSPGQYFSSARRLAAIDDPENNPYAEIYHVPPGAIPGIKPQSALDARLGSTVRLLGFDLKRDRDRVDVTLYWNALGEPSGDYTVFFHLLGPHNNPEGSPVWAQDDAQPGHGSYPTTRWRAGETILDHYSVTWPAGSPPGLYQAEAGMYSLKTGARVPVWIDGQRVAEDRILLGSIEK